MTILIGAAFTLVLGCILVAFVGLSILVVRMARTPNSKLGSVVDAQLNGDINILDGVSPHEMAYIAKLLTRQRSADKAQSIKEQMVRSAQTPTTE